MVDEVDFVESDYVEFYEAAINVHVSIGGDLLMEQQSLNFDNEAIGVRRWVQNGEEGLIGGGSYDEFSKPVSIEWRQRKELEMHGIDEQFDELESMMGAA